MWQYILQFLAIIGIILLVLLALTVLLFGIVCFAPIRYRIVANVDTKEKHYLIQGKAGWLLNILTVSCGYPEPNMLIVRLFGYPIKKIDFAATPEEQSEEQVKEQVEEQVEEQTDEYTDTVQGKEEITAQGSQTPIGLIAGSVETDGFQEPQADLDEKHNGKTVLDWYHKIVCTIKKLCDKIKEIWDTIQYYKDFFDEKQTRLFIDRCKKRLGKILKAIAPKHIKGNLNIGTGSPDTTGYLVAVYGMMVPYLDKDFILEPDFENAVCCGNVTARGRIYLWTALTVLVGFTSDKYLSVLLKKLKREEQ